MNLLASRCLIFFLAVVGLGLAPASLEAASRQVGIAAVVNQEPITFDDIDTDPQASKEIADLQKKYPGADLSDRVRKVRLATLDRLVASQLIVEEFLREGHFYTDAQVDDFVAAEIKRDYDGKEDSLDAALARFGETMDEYRIRIRDQAIVAFMTTQNVDKNITAQDPAEAAKQRESLRQAWLTSLRSKAFISILSRPNQ